MYKGNNPVIKRLGSVRLHSGVSFYLILVNCWFSHDVTKIQTKKLAILLSFHFHEVLKYPNTFIYTNFRFKKVIRFAIEDA